MITTDSSIDFPHFDKVDLIEALPIADGCGKALGYVVAIPGVSNSADYVPYLYEGCKLGPAYVDSQFAIDWIINGGKD